MSDHQPLTVTFTIDEPAPDPRGPRRRIRRALAAAAVLLVVPAAVTMLALTLGATVVLASLGAGLLYTVTVLPAWFLIARRLLVRTAAEPRPSV